MSDYHHQPPRATIFGVTTERWAQIGITVEFLIVVRTLGEFFRLRYSLGTNFSTAVATPYIGGALIAACSCWAAVTFYFSDAISLLTGPVIFNDKNALWGVNMSGNRVAPGTTEPGGNQSTLVWTVQLDVDLDFSKPKPPAPAAK